MNSAPPCMSNAPPSGIRQRLAGIGMAIALGGLTYLVTLGWEPLFGKTTHAVQMETVCDPIAGPCTAQFDDGTRISFTVRPKERAAVPSLLVTVDTHGLEADDLSVEFQGVRMNMGVVTTPLVRIDGNSYAGNAVLPVCVRSSMAWSATVVGDTADTLYRAGFTFVMSRR